MKYSNLFTLLLAGSAFAGPTKPTANPSASVESWTEKGEMLSHRVVSATHTAEPTRHHIPGPGPASLIAERKEAGAKKTLSTVYVTKPVHKSDLSPGVEIIGRATVTPAPTPVLDRRTAKKKDKQKKDKKKHGDGDEDVKDGKEHGKKPTKTKHPNDNEDGTPDDLCSPAWKKRFMHRWNGNKIALHHAMAKYCGNREWKGHLEDECDGYNDPEVADDESVCTVDPKGVPVGAEGGP